MGGVLVVGVVEVFSLGGEKLRLFDRIATALGFGLFVGDDFVSRMFSDYEVLFPHRINSRPWEDVIGARQHLCLRLLRSLGVLGA